MTTAGIAIRGGIILLWLILLGWHALDFFAPGFGKSVESAALIVPNLDRTMTYQVHRNQNASIVATCSISVARDEARFKSTLSINITDPSAIPGVGLVAKTLSDGGSAPMSLVLTQQLDERFRLVSFSAQGTAFHAGIQATGYMDLSRLIGKYRINAGPWTPIELSGISNEPSAGLGMTVSLPAGLKPGDTFSTRMTTFDIASLSAKPMTADYVVQDHETLVLGHHEIPTLRVAMSTAHRPTAVIWCDDQGTAYRIQVADLGLTLDLAAINSVLGEKIWPTPATTTSRPSLVPAL